MYQHQSARYRTQRHAQSIQYQRDNGAYEAEMHDCIIQLKTEAEASSSRDAKQKADIARLERQARVQAHDHKVEIESHYRTEEWNDNYIADLEAQVITITKDSQAQVAKKDEEIAKANEELTRVYRMLQSNNEIPEKRGELLQDQTSGTHNVDSRTRQFEKERTELYCKIQGLEEEIGTLSHQVNSGNQAVMKLQEDHEQELQLLEEEHQKAIENLNGEASTEHARTEERHREAVDSQRSRAETDRAQTIEEQRKALDNLQHKAASAKTAMEAQHKQTVDKLKGDLTSTQAEFNKLKSIHARCGQSSDTSGATGEGMDVDETNEHNPTTEESGSGMDVDQMEGAGDQCGQPSQSRGQDEMHIDSTEQTDGGTAALNNRSTRVADDAGDEEMAMEVFEHEVDLRVARDGKKRA